MKPIAEPLARRVVIACAVALALPLVVFAYPPMTDLPHHEALVGLLRHGGDATMFPPGMYVRNLGQPNQLFHLVAWPFSYVLGVTFACKLVAAFAVASVPLGALRLARHVGASPLAVLALAPIAIGWLFTWGFVNNLMGLGILFAFLPEVDRFAAGPDVRSFLRALLGAALLYLGHELIMFVYVGAVLLFALLRAPSVLGVLLRALPAVVALAVAALQIVLQEKLKTDSIKMVPNVWTSFGEKVREMPSVLFGGADRSLRWAIAAGVVALVGASLYARPKPGLRSIEQWRARLEVYRFELLALSSLGLYFIAPFTFNGAMLVHERFLAPAFGIAVVCTAVGAPSQWPALLAGAFATLVPLVALLPWFGDSVRNYRALETLFEHIAMKSSVAAVDLDKTQGGRPFTVASGLSRVLVRRGGRVVYSFAESTVAPVRIAPAHLWNEPSARIMLDNGKLRPAHDLTRFRYLLVHSSEPQRLPLVAMAVRDEASFVAAVGEWALFESKLQVAAIESPDVPLPEPRPETIARRLWFVEKAVREGAPPGGAR